MKRVAVALLFLSIGTAGGLVLTGRMRSAADTAAAPAVERVAAPEPSPAQTVPRAAAGTPDFTTVAAATVKAVTNISSLQIARGQPSPFANDPFFRYFFGDQDDLFGRDRREQSLGSGVIVSSDGYILTNVHVVGDRRSEITVAMADKREVPAQIVGVDRGTDIALLKVNATGLPVIPWGDSSQLKVAEWVLAIGNPFQLSQTVTLGIVSAVGRANVGVAQYEDFIQTDAAINPGNSGGALINARGELVGINTAIYSQSGGYQGVGFAVPSNLTRRVMNDLIKYGEVRRGSVGRLVVSPLTTRVARELGLANERGALVSQIRTDSPAYEAGLRPGDVIVGFNSQTVEEPSQFVRFLADAAIGSTATLTVIRDGRRVQVKVPIGLEQRGRRS
jgi:serine protease Do